MLTKERKKQLDIDLWIILIISMKTELLSALLAKDMVLSIQK